MSAKHAAVVAIGTFDGVHRGHRRLLSVLREKARTAGAVPTVIAFARPVRSILANSIHSLISPWDEKKELLRAAGVRHIIRVRFSARFRHLSPASFFRTVLVRRFDLRGLVVGADFRFGYAHRGTVHVLRRLCRSAGVPLFVVPKLRSGGAPVSSRRIRRLLEQGSVGEACRLLGSPYQLTGRVIPGMQLGRKLGFPTINLAVSRDKILPRGVFAAYAEAGGSRWRAACYIGSKKTAVPDAWTTVVEAYLLDWHGTFKPRTATISLVRRVRGDRRFRSLPALTAQIRRDVSVIRKDLMKNENRKM